MVQRPGRQHPCARSTRLRDRADVVYQTADLLAEAIDVDDIPMFCHFPVAHSVHVDAAHDEWLSGRRNPDELTDSNVLVPPDLVVEVVSTNDLAVNLEERVSDYLSAGVKRMDLAITIRTCVIANGVASVQSAAGVVYDSVPEREFLEHQNKVRALLTAIGQIRPSRR